MKRKGSQQAFGAGDLDREPHRLLQGERGFDEVIGDQLRQRIGNTDRESQGSARRSPLHAFGEFATQSEDLVRVTEHDVAHFGEAQTPPCALEELFAKGAFERTNLSAQGGLRQPQQHRSASHRPFARDHPEIEEMPVIESLHGLAPYIVIADELQPNYLVFVRFGIRDVRHARGSPPRHLGRKPLEVGTERSPFSRKGRSLTMKTPMFASILKYNSAPTLVEELVKRQDEIKSLLSPIQGFHAYYLLKSSDGAFSMTVCDDRAGVEESNRIASTWLKDKLPTFANRAPEITIGELQMHVNGKLPVPVTV